jgi:hypothetical protein
MARVLCTVTEGLRQAEATVEIRDANGRREFLPIARDFLMYENGQAYLPVPVLALDRREKVALVALPIEADSGANRIWVKTANLRDWNEAPA